MRKFALLLLPLLMAANWQETLNTGLKAVNSATSQNSGDYKSVVASALDAAVKQLSANGGFLNSATAKIPLPKSLETAANLAKKVGGQKWADDMIASMNNAASSAVGGASEVFADTIKNMSEAEVKQIFAGDNKSFTTFLKEKSGNKLNGIFKPIIEKMMADNKFATAYNGLNSLVAGSETMKSAKNLATNFGMGEYIPDENEDLTSYITRKTLDGLFNVMGEKESGLRGGAVGKGTELLKGILKQ